MGDDIWSAIKAEIAGMPLLLKAVLSLQPVAFAAEIWTYGRPKHDQPPPEPKSLRKLEAEMKHLLARY